MKRLRGWAPQPWIEMNFDSLVGPTHHFGGLGVGNVASQRHGGQTARPRAAALQGLDKVARLAALGAQQALLPPQRRPDLRLLRRVGFLGSEAEMLVAAAAQSLPLLSAAWSASAMWAANAATVSPSCDTADGRTHLSVANLTSSVHRSLEPPQTAAILRRVLGGAPFVVHPPLPSAAALRDEGAANQMRLSDATGSRGIEVFVHGEPPAAGAADAAGDSRRRFPARQTLWACEAIARRHQLDPGRTFFLRQSPRAIDAGVFHNDVVATSCREVLLYHQAAYEDAGQSLAPIADIYRRMTGQPLRLIEVREDQLSLDDAVQSYLFNSQLIVAGDDPEAPMTLVCPQQCREVAAAARVIEQLLRGENPIERVEYVELRESMHNGGGPACLRLRVPMTLPQRQAIDPRVLWTPRLEERLRGAVERFYPESLMLADLADRDLLHQVQRAHAEVLAAYDF